MSEIRHNLLKDSYVIIAPERMHRPAYNMAWKKEERSMSTCPFCEGNESMTPAEIFAVRENKSLPDKPGWKSRVVPNLYKAVQVEAQYNSRQEGIYSAWDGFGAHEIIIDSPRHLDCMVEWENDTFLVWLKTLQARIKDLRQDERIAFISIFKNHGLFAGATQAHPHTQLIGLPVVPRGEIDKYIRKFDHYRNTGRALISDIIAQEEHNQDRIIAQEGTFTAFCPYASAYPFEVMIAAKDAIGTLDRIDESHLEDLSKLLKIIFYKLRKQLGNFDFNMAVSIPPMQKHFDTDAFFNHIDEISRFSVHIMPRIYRHGGFELSTGMMINPVEPERSAKLLRGVEYGEP